jgi:hypothetical protein
MTLRVRSCAAQDARRARGPPGTSTIRLKGRGCEDGCAVRWDRCERFRLGRISRRVVPTGTTTNESLSPKTRTEVDRINGLPVEALLAALGTRPARFPRIEGLRRIGREYGRLHACRVPEVACSEVCTSSFGFHATERAFLCDCATCMDAPTLAWTRIGDASTSRRPHYDD